VDEHRFAISYSPTVRWLFELLAMGPRISGVVVTDDRIRVRMGWAFSAEIPRSAITSVERDSAGIGGIGVHGWRSQWLVNGATTGLVRIQIDPPAPARAIGFGVRLRTLRLSLSEPSEFMALVVRPTV
jgi:hypothetical protein